MLRTQTPLPYPLPYTLSDKFTIFMALQADWKTNDTGGHGWPPTCYTLNQVRQTLFKRVQAL